MLKIFSFFTPLFFLLFFGSGPVIRDTGWVKIGIRSVRSFHVSRVLQTSTECSKLCGSGSRKAELPRNTREKKKTLLDQDRTKSWTQI
jgi:hypothetical protein